MRILMLNNKYLQRGGEEVVFETEVEMLRSNGCEVDTLIEDNEKVQQLGGLRTAARAIWSRESYRQVRAQLQSKSYDVMHVHNFFPLFSPSVYYAARAEGVPVVQTLHQYRLMCPVGTFFRDGAVCEDCVNKMFPWPAVRHKCYRGSATASAAVGGMLTGHRLAGTWRNLVTYYIALSEFGRRKFIEAGLPEEKVVIKPNFLPRAAKAAKAGEGKGGYAVFVGRICEEKGVDTLLAAWHRIGDRLPLKIIGEGPYFDQAAKQVRDMDGVELMGWQDSEAVYRLIGDAECIVVPSRWYEGQPVVVIEALGMGTPLIISRIGPMQEFVEDKVSGLLFDPGNAEDLASKIEWMIENKDQHPAMRQAARSKFEAQFSAERNFELMMDVYRAAKLSVQPADAGSDSVPLASDVNRVES